MRQKMPLFYDNEFYDQICRRLLEVAGSKACKDCAGRGYIEGIFSRWPCDACDSTGVARASSATSEQPRAVTVSVNKLRSLYDAHTIVDRDTAAGSIEMNGLKYQFRIPSSVWEEADNAGSARPVFEFVARKAKAHGASVIDSDTGTSYTDPFAWAQRMR